MKSYTRCYLLSLLVHSKLIHIPINHVLSYNLCSYSKFGRIRYLLKAKLANIQIGFPVLTDDTYYGKISSRVIFQKEMDCTKTRLILFLFSYPRTAFPLWNISLTLEPPCRRGIEILYNLWGKRQKGTLSGSWERGSHLHCQCGEEGCRGGPELFWFLGKFCCLHWRGASLSSGHGCGHGDKG